MKRTKKALSLFLALIFVLTAFSVAMTANAASTDPTVYVQGQGHEIYNADGTMAYTDGRVPIPEDLDLGAAVKECLPLFAKAVASDDWTEYRAAILKYWAPIYTGVSLDKNGEPSNGSSARIALDFTPNYPSWTFGGYHFESDWRLDPYYNAQILGKYIDDVLALTGASKVNLVLRCEGVNIGLAYLAEYGGSKINCVEMYVSAAYGVDAVSAAISGNFVLYPDALSEFYYSDDVQTQLPIEDEALKSFIDSILDFAVDSYGIEGACTLLTSLMPKFYKEFVSDMLLCSYGTMPGVWALVNQEDYPVARERVFGGKEKEFAGLLEKLDKYDVEVRQNIPGLIEEMKGEGVKFAVIAKYIESGYYVPICKEALGISDNACSVNHASHGATCSNRAEQLSDSYLAKADPKYISPDKRIDASTCIDPDHTWIVYNSDHKDFNEAIDNLLIAFLKADGNMDVFSNPSYPQYIYYNGSTIEPLKEEHIKVDFTPDENEPPRINRAVDKFVALIKDIIQRIKDFFKSFIDNLGK